MAVEAVSSRCHHRGWVTPRGSSFDDPLEVVWVAVGAVVGALGSPLAAARRVRVGRCDAAVNIAAAARRSRCVAAVHRPHIDTLDSRDMRPQRPSNPVLLPPTTDPRLGASSTCSAPLSPDTEGPTIICVGFGDHRRQLPVMTHSARPYGRAAPARQRLTGGTDTHCGEAVHRLALQAFVRAHMSAIRHDVVPTAASRRVVQTVAQAWRTASTQLGIYCYCSMFATIWSAPVSTGLDLRGGS